MDFENSIVHFPATHRHLTFVNILIPKQFRNPKRNTDKGENFSAVQGRIRDITEIHLVGLREKPAACVVCLSSHKRCPVLQPCVLSQRPALTGAGLTHRPFL